MKKLRILIFIEVDVVVRHFVDSQIFNALAAKHDVTFVFPGPGTKRFGNLDPGTMPLPGEYLRVPHHAERTRLWKEIFQVDQLRFRCDPQGKALRALRWNAVGWKAGLLYTVFGLPGIWPIFRGRRLRQLAGMPNVAMEELFDREKPDVVIHPCVLEGFYINDLVEVCGRRKIPLTVIMNSWDNPSTKRAMVGNPDWLLVWGEQTKRHAVEMAHLPPDRVLSFGAAQFEIYRKPPRIDRAEFCKLNGIPTDRPILLYAGSSKGTDEIAHLSLLDAAVDRGELSRAVVLYRPHPWGNGGKGGETLLDRSWRNVFIESSMRGYLEEVRAGKTAKYLADYADAHDVLANVDAVVSPLSTILLEAAMHEKPILCFLPQEDGSSHFAHDAALSHFHDMFRMPDILVAPGYDALLPQCEALMRSCDDRALRDRLKEAVRFFVEPYEEPYESRLVTFIESTVAAHVQEITR